MILSYKPRISLRILPPINVANARYHSLLGNNNFSSGFNSFEQRAISFQNQWSHRIGSGTVHSTSECMTLWMTSSNLTSGRRSFGGDSPLLCRLTTPILHNLVRPGEYLTMRQWRHSLTSKITKTPNEKPTLTSKRGTHGVQSMGRRENSKTSLQLSWIVSWATFL